MSTQQTYPDSRVRANGVEVIRPERYELRRENGRMNPLAQAFETGVFAAGAGQGIDENRYKDKRGSRAFHDAWRAGWQAWHDAKAAS